MPDSALKRLANMRKPGQWIISVIEGEQFSSREHRREPGWFTPTILGNDCNAYLAFQYLGAPGQETIEAKTRRIFDYGEHREGYLQKYTKSISLINKPEERRMVIPELHIRGEVDNLVRNPSTGEKYIIDYKTMRSDLWKHLTEVKPEHHIQVLPYEFSFQAYKGGVIYENKDTQELKHMQADFDPAMWKTKVVDRIERVLGTLAHGFVERTPTSCSRCPFYENGVCTTNQIDKLKEESGLKF